MLAVALAACGGDAGSAAPQLAAPPPARQFRLAAFQPGDTAEAGRPTDVSFRIDQPDGKPLTKYATGAGPHTGVHVLFVRDDLSTIIHHHPPVQPDGTVGDKVTFKEPGRYRVVVDAYPGAPAAQKNFQLFRWITVSGKAHAKPIPAYEPTQVVDGYKLAIEGKPALKALEAAFLSITVTDPKGRPAAFTPWYGALAHAIFFRTGTLDYFHTHVCAPGASGCTSTLGGAQVTGTSQTPGKLEVGVLLPVPGTWRLFIQCKVRGKVLTAPFTLNVS
ncbi:hypothetical protein [Candidatus Solirubrobacter pratensis]|uniref:hypothetical protein n=1 Tax=Candidatus Solirubrobacter pratensis TaxID=1298857 RepID=UPI0003FDB516|nr:hypothetical protein [Candidatus Solirubrobacter pratensis]